VGSYPVGAGDSVGSFVQLELDIRCRVIQLELDALRSVV
jgi:hypothetical protein